MKFEYPETILICNDDYHTKHIGLTSDGVQFFLTTPFIPASEDKGCEFIALYKFDSRGILLTAEIEKLGPRESLDEAGAMKKYESMLNGLGKVTFCDINIAPFKVEKFGVEFGLMPIEEEFVEDEDGISLEMQPGNVMAFYPPWDGDYDT